jgi:peptidoglycan LD-endopeptidase CwlK
LWVPRDLLLRVDWSLIYPPLREKMFDLAAACRARGADYFAISGYRSPEEQAKLYFQGRTTPGKIVTNAKPGFSAHQYGIAVDWCRDADLDRRGLQPDWSLAAYEILAEEAERLGLEAALRWKRFREGPHVQLPLTSRNLSVPMLKGRADKTGKLESAWHLLDANGPWFP